MKLYFAKADLSLHKNDAGDYVLEQCGELLETFKSEKKALAKYNRIRLDLEAKMPSAEVTDEERRALLEKYLADSLVKHNSLRDEMVKKPPRSRTFG